MTHKPESLPESLPTAGKKALRKAGRWGKPLHSDHIALSSQPSQSLPIHLESSPYHGQQGLAGLAPLPPHIPHLALASLLFLEHLLSSGVCCPCFLEHLTPDHHLPHSRLCSNMSPQRGLPWPHVQHGTHPHLSYHLTLLYFSS